MCVLQKVSENILTNAILVCTTKLSLGEKQYCPWAIAIDSSNSVSHTNIKLHNYSSCNRCSPRHWGHSMHGRVPPVSGTTTILCMYHCNTMQQ